jgi:hypothetical protein
MRASLLLQITDPSERDYVVSELAQAEVRAGFASEALSTAALRSNGTDILLKDIGSIQAARGQYESALATVAGQNRIIRDEVREEIGIEQARRGEVQGALQTAASMLDGYDKESVLYFVALELLRQGQTRRAKEIAASFTATDYQLPDESSVGRGFDWRKSIPPPAPLREYPQAKPFYTDAVAQLRLGNVTKAISIVEADDNPADVSSNFSRLATEATALGNLDAALKLSAKVHVPGARYAEDYYSGTLLPIADSGGQEMPPPPRNGPGACAPLPREPWR